MKYNLTIQSEDYGFITEAIKLRTLAVLESLEKQVAIQVTAHIRSESPFSQDPVKAEDAPVSFVAKSAKKPHWTQTAKGKKTMAARKTRGTK